MADLIRDAPIGQIIRFLTSNRVLQYPEEKPDFQCPNCYAHPDLAAKAREQALTSQASTLQEQTPGSEEVEEVEKDRLEDAEPDLTDSPVGLSRDALERVETFRSFEDKDLEKAVTARSQLAKIGTRQALAKSHTRAELEEAFRAAAQLTKEPSRPIIPERTSDGTILVDWYTTDDPENPQNWSSGKKAFASLQIYLYTFAFYMGSSIYTPSEAGIMKQFHVGYEAASLGLALYVFAYGIGPLIFSPLSEIPIVGRNPPYIITMGIFVALCVAAPLVDNFAGLIVLRFLQGFFGSPCLATGGASLQDMYSLIKLPYVLCIWAMAATLGPALGPVISGFSVAAENWRWSLWEMLWLCGPVFLSMLLFLPETSQSNILLRRAQRLRKINGDSRLKAQSEIDQANMTVNSVIYEALVRPMQLIIQDPAIAYCAAYIALCYAIYYSFFEVFPLVYIDRYHFVRTA